MKEGGGGGDGGFVRADQIDLKSLDEQLERHLSRAWTMEKRKEEASGGTDQRGARQHSRRPRREDWEINPAKLVVKGVIARGTFGTVHRGIYDAHDVAGSLLRRRHYVLCTPHAPHRARARLVAPESPRRTANAAPVGTAGGSRACVRARRAPLLSVASFGKLRELTRCFFGGFPCRECDPVTSVGWIGRLLVAHVNRDHRLVVILVIAWSRNAAIVGCEVTLGIPQRQRTL
jgi:hypothetical protein